MSRKVLLIEPNYINKYPPLGLMKISQYHKEKGDTVVFFKGLSPELRDKYEWDRIYVSSLFTYDWKETIRTLKYYRYSIKGLPSEDLILGGVLATLLSEDIKKEVNCKIVKGLLNKKGQIGYYDDNRIDSMVPDYNILDEIEYKYPAADSYIAYATRGCVRRCKFCAVPKIEPQFKHYLPIKKQVEEIEKRYGSKKDLLLLDNNVLASKDFKKIIKIIKSLGFEKDAKYKYLGKQKRLVTANRYVDFNQGLDARLLTEENIALLSEIALRPLRIAFDNIESRELYEEKIRLASKYSFKYLSNYILYNYQDKPEDFYFRLRINCELNQELGLKIYSFPMRYIDLSSKNRSTTTPGNIGLYWNKKYLRAIQCVLNATRGIVGGRLDFFEEAFGHNVEEYKKILIMPEDYIINRFAHREDGSADLWWRQFNELSSLEKEVFLGIVYSNIFHNIDYLSLSKNIRKILSHYISNSNDKSLISDSVI